MKNLRYTLKGVGADQDPFNLFVVNPETGFVRITAILDRESIAQYNVSEMAMMTMAIDDDDDEVGFNTYSY